MPRHKFQPVNKFGGRKPISEEVKELAHAATPRAIQRQIELMESKDENVALKQQTLYLIVCSENLHRHSIEPSLVKTCLTTRSPT